MENSDKKINNLVVKKNELIQKSRYGMTTQEQKVILYTISKVKPDDKELYEYDFNLQDMCEALGITQNGKNYKNLRETLQSIRDKSFWIVDGNVRKLCAWISGAEIYENESRVRIQLDKRLAPYLLELKESYTAYQLQTVLNMESKHTIRLYEILKSSANIGEYTVSVENLKTLMQIGGYSDFIDFRKRVIDTAVDEINAVSDLRVAYEPTRTGRSITHIKFSITKARSNP